eukprot:1157922-Pelagomonas_calceolata.AAC.19
MRWPRPHLQAAPQKLSQGACIRIPAARSAVNGWVAARKGEFVWAIHLFPSTHFSKECSEWVGCSKEDWKVDKQTDARKT